MRPTNRRKFVKKGLVGIGAGITSGCLSNDGRPRFTPTPEGALNDESESTKTPTPDQDRGPTVADWTPTNTLTPPGPGVFDDGMILQRGMAVPVWGTAESGQTITVSFAGQTHQTETDENGMWLVKLDPLDASSTGRIMTIEGADTTTIDDILVGEVWFASGQSNMKDRFVKYNHPPFPEEYVDGDLSTFRFSTREGWFPVSKEHEEKISRVAFYFGIDLYKELDIPVGFVFRAAGGTPIQAWMPEDLARTLQQHLNIPSDWNEGPDPGNKRPGQQFESKVEPIVPFAIRGVIWYQGERNAKKGTGYEYDILLREMVSSWRKLWAEQSNQELRKFPFYYVQPPVRDGTEFPWLRDRMRRALDMIENSGMAIFVDYGPKLHPPEKEPAGHRLALLALANDYGYEDLIASGPLLDAVSYEQGEATLTFRNVGDGLEKNIQGDQYLRFFEIAGEDGEYERAPATITGDDTVVVASDNVTNPTYVRYLFDDGIPQVSLVNSAGLPASPFMTDDFKPERE